MRVQNSNSGRQKCLETGIKRHDRVQFERYSVMAATLPSLTSLTVQKTKNITLVAAFDHDRCLGIFGKQREGQWVGKTINFLEDLIARLKRRARGGRILVCSFSNRQSDTINTMLPPPTNGDLLTKCFGGRDEFEVDTKYYGAPLLEGVTFTNKSEMKNWMKGPIVDGIETNGNTYSLKRNIAMNIGRAYPSIERIFFDDSDEILDALSSPPSLLTEKDTCVQWIGPTDLALWGSGPDGQAMYETKMREAGLE